jgi:hypothetical protein
MEEITLQVLPPLTILAIGLAFGFLIGMLFYYPEIQGLRTRIKKILKINKA